MIKVLIVEDETLLRKGLIHTFDWTSVGCIVIGEAEDGISGLNLIEALDPDIVITDIRMPAMDGLEMLKIASATKKFTSILLTGHSEFDYAKKAVSLKVFEYLLKPIDEKQLTNTLLKAIEQINQEKLISALNDKGYSEFSPNFEKFFKKENNLDYYVKEALATIKNNYQTDLSVSVVAGDLQISKSYLCRRFKEQTDNTFVEFLNKYRVTKAIHLLDKGDLQIAQVAAEVGFNQYKNFAKVFKRYVGMTASEFINSNIRILDKDTSYSK